MTEGNRNLLRTTVSKNKHGIRIFSKSKERDSVESNINRSVWDSDPRHRLFERDEEQNNQMKLTCCPSSGDLKSITSSVRHFQNRVQRGKKIKPINHLVCKYQKPIRLFHKLPTN
jgi:hypothetical protein